jgi:hypothetical protein
MKQEEEEEEEDEEEARKWMPFVACKDRRG